jgi:hypothetical protein
MAHIIDLKTFTDSRGNLTVIENVIPFEIKRIFYIYGVNDAVRGHHRHKKTRQAAISLQGACRISNQNGDNKPIKEFILNSPSLCIIIEPEDYHWMDMFTPDCILMVLASENFDQNDYIRIPYKSII